MQKTTMIYSSKLAVQLYWVQATSLRSLEMPSLLIY